MTTNEVPSTQPDTPPPNGLFGLISRISIANVMLSYTSRHDALTGLLNKDACKQDIEERIQADQSFGVIILDLDGFKAVNDNLGHTEGDRLLEDFGSHLRSAFRREGDAIAHEKMIQQPLHEGGQEVPVGRWGGDEFVIAPDLSDRDRNDGLSIEQRMDREVEYAREVIIEFVGQQNQPIKDQRFNASLGYAIRRPGSTDTVTDLLEVADSGMYADKKAHDAPVR